MATIKKVHAREILDSRGTTLRSPRLALLITCQDLYSLEVLCGQEYIIKTYKTLKMTDVMLQ